MGAIRLKNSIIRRNERHPDRGILERAAKPRLAFPERVLHAAAREDLGLERLVGRDQFGGALLDPPLQLVAPRLRPGIAALEAQRVPESNQTASHGSDHSWYPIAGIHRPTCASEDAIENFILHGEREVNRR